MNQSLNLILLCALINITNALYDYRNGGDNWDGDCITGKEQSPINIEDIRNTCDNSMVLDIKLSNKIQSTLISLDRSLISLGNWGSFHGTDVNGNLFGYNFKTVSLFLEGLNLAYFAENFITQFNVHAPSEHKIDGDSYDVEMHIYGVLKADFEEENIRHNGILALMFNVDDNNQDATFFQSWDTSQIGQNFDLNFASALSRVSFDDNYYVYQGSLTTPPCTETVNWYVFPQAYPITTLQLRTISQYFAGDLTFANGNGNNRGIQSLNDREIKRGNTPCEEQFIYFFSFFILYIFINYFIFKLL